MFGVLLKHPRALALSVALHVVVIGLIFVNFHFSEKPVEIKAGQIEKTVQAEVVEQQQLDAMERKKQQEAQKIKDAASKKKQQEAQKLAEQKKKEAEIKRQAEAKKKAELKRKKEAEDKRRQETERKAAEKRKADEKRKAEEKRLAAEQREADEKRIAEENRRAEEARKAEAARIAEEKRKAEEARIAEEKRKAEEARIAEEKRRAEEARIAEQKRKEAELKAKLQAEENQRRLSSLEDAYKVAIMQKIRRNWIRPAGSENIPNCEVRVLQGPGGIILDVTFGNCPGGNNAYRLSIENAVYKAEPLPKPGDPAIFARELDLNFKPE